VEKGVCWTARNPIHDEADDTYPKPSGKDRSGPRMIFEAIKIGNFKLVWGSFPENEQASIT